MRSATRAPRVLMVAHAFPPAGGSGPNRALAFARYLPAFGWRPIVLTTGVEWVANRDDALLTKLPAEVHVVRTRSLEPTRTATAPVSLPAKGKDPSALRRQLGHLKRFPDAHIGWLPYALSAARTQPFELIYSSSGPFTSHVVGLALQRITGRPLVAELRDGWYRWNRAIFPDYPAWRGVLESRLEAAVIRSARKVVLVTERMADLFRCQYADLPASHFGVVSNGFDPAQIASAAAVDAPTEIEILHAGALYYGRSLASFLDAAASIADALPPFKITLLGTLDAKARAEIAHHPLGDRIRWLGQRDHAATLAAMRSASLLLLVANTTTGAEATAPGKLFEYLAIGRPVLAIAPPNSSSADVLAATGAGWLAPAGDVTAIAETLRRAVCAPPPRADARAVARYDRRVLARELAHIFDEVFAAHRI